MSINSSIEWTDSTWNPVTGCQKVSPGCKNCYAETFAERWRGVANHPYEQGFDLRLWPTRVQIPLTWKKKKTIFVNSMSDLFHEKIPLNFIQDVFQTMNKAYWHTFQILTKRPERMYALKKYLKWSDNIWQGVSIESQEFAWRAQYLKKIPAKIRFLSLEPLLGPVQLNMNKIHWVIVGGESGARCRTIQASWVRDVRKQCKNYQVPFFFKQWGGVQKKKNGRELDGRIYNEMPISLEDL